MIYESSFYKEELGKIANRLAKQKINKKRSERSLFLLEKDFFTAFFYIRKLVEAKTKLTKKVSETKISVLQFSKKAEQRPTILNDHEFETIYDLSRGLKLTKDLRFLCNQFTHSYIFCPDFSDNKKINSLFINSFFERENSLYKVNIDNLIEVIRSCAESYPSEAHMIYNPSKQDFEIIKSQ